MKRLSLISLLLVFYLFGKSQDSMFGFYKLITDDKDNRMVSLTLNCDKTFILEDSTFKHYSKGTWREQTNALFLALNDTIKGSDSARWFKAIKYLIKNGRLYSSQKIMSERQYNSENSSNNGKVLKPIGERQTHESYESYKRRAEKTYFLKVNSIKCE